VDHFIGTATIGYWLGRDYWRQGIMAEAANEVIRFAFEDLSLRRLNIEAFVENEASNNLIKKLGFVFEGTQIQGNRSRATNKVHDAHQYRMLREEWKHQEG
jgi:[ribosomal protein S5]-alanine N-acetyltransferase